VSRGVSIEYRSSQRLNLITEAAHRSDQVAGRSELGAESGDMGIDSAGIADMGDSPDIVQETFTALHPAEPFGKTQKQSELGAREKYLFTGDIYSMTFGVYVEESDSDVLPETSPPFVRRRTAFTRRISSLILNGFDM